MESLKEKILEVVMPRLNPYLIILFGSTAQGISRGESDIDIAFLSEKEQDTYDHFIIAQDLAAKLNRDVDLINLKKASTVFQAQIVSSGIVLYCSDEKRRNEFEMKALAMYARLNEERKVVIDAIRESGTVYGE